MKVKYPKLEIDRDLSSEKEISAFIRGLCDELFLIHSFLTYYMTVSAMYAPPSAFPTLRSSIEGVLVEWIFTGKDMDQILQKRKNRYESLMKRAGIILPNNMEVS